MGIFPIISYLDVLRLILSIDFFPLILYNIFRVKKGVKEMIAKFDTNSTKALRSWFKRNNLVCGCELCAVGDTAWGNTFYYDEETHRVGLPRAYNFGVIDKAFLSHLKERGLTTEVNWLVMTILHEIGHSETVRFFTEKEMKKIGYEKFLLSIKITKENLVETNCKYWNLPDEDMANRWAINYANTFPEKVKRLEKVLLSHCEFTEE